MIRFSIVFRRIYLHLFSSNSSAPHPEFGGSGITEDCYLWILKNITHGSKVLEFGAGLVSTKKLSQHYELTSIEQDSRFIGKFNSSYIHAPLDSIYGYYQQELKKTGIQ